MQHQHVCIKQLTFGSYLGVASAVAAATGVVLAAVGLLSSLFGADVYLRFLPLFHIENISEGLVALVVMPLVFALFGLVLGAITYYPFHWVLRFSGGLTLSGTMSRQNHTRQKVRREVSKKQQRKYVQQRS